MFTVCFSILLFAQLHPLTVVGKVRSPVQERFRLVEIESIDRRFVNYADVGFDGSFVFKKVPEGLYKLTIVRTTGQAEQRTIEVRSSFADTHGRITVKIELTDAAVAGDAVKIGVGALGISPKARDDLRRAFDARGNIAKARRHLEKAIEISPNFDEALNDLGTMYYRDRQYDKARDLFERALAANPNLYAAQVNLGGALISLGNYERALTENSKAVQMRPGDSLAQSQVGQTLFYLKQYDEALVHLEQVKRIDPVSFTLPGIFIAQIYESRGDKVRAVAEYKEFLKVHPVNPYTAFIQNALSRLEKQ
jgi:tetratricopeptide (TPR) repeat protein